MPVGAFAAEKKQQAPAVPAKKQQAQAPVKNITKTDEVLLREHRARLAEISNIEKAPGPGKAAALKPMLSDKNPLVRGEAAEAMGKTKDPAALGELSTAVKSEDEHTRWGAVRGLADLGDNRAVPPLITALGHPEENTRWKAAQALGELKDVRAVDALAAAARSDKNKNVRLAAIEALMKIGGPKAAAAAEGLKSDPDPEIKAWAGAAAEKLKQK
ncbi:MAG: HEAT repeat domain-containing protein [Elusimicrobiales bacterium]|nr:HEAT repeat domain-containing protein [Elusimicrobiales bacterium]